MNVQSLPGAVLIPLIPALGTQSQENLKEESIKKKKISRLADVWYSCLESPQHLKG